MAQLLDIQLNEAEDPGRSAPIDVLDRAFALLRRAGLQAWLRGVAAGLPLAAALIAVYALERVLGGQPSLPLFAALCSLAYWARYHLLSAVALELVGCHPRQSTLWAGLKTAVVAGIGSCAWAACLIAIGERSFFGLLACLPLLCVRGALAPSLLARSACAPEAGVAALARALADTRALRHVFVRVELLVLIGLLVLFGNLYALAASLLFVASSVLGLDVGFVNALIAPDNELVLLLLLGLATLLLEPLRAAVSTVAFQSGRDRSEAADLHAALNALNAIDVIQAPPRNARGTLVALLALGMLSTTAHAHEAHKPLAHDASALDATARQKAHAILARGEFQPSVTDSERGPVQAWLDRRLRERERDLFEHDLSAPPRFELHVPPIVVMSLSLTLLLGVGLWLARGLRRARNEASLRASIAPTQADKLDEALRLSRAGVYAAALRSLYAACVLALARDKTAGFGSSQTNGQLLRQLAPGRLRAAFEHLTQRFERCCYGLHAVSQTDFEAARMLAEQILQAANEAPR